MDLKVGAPGTSCIAEASSRLLYRCQVYEYVNINLLIQQAGTLRGY